jgi:hypothetical protein
VVLDFTELLLVTVVKSNSSRRQPRHWEVSGLLEHMQLLLLVYTYC